MKKISQTRPTFHFNHPPNKKTASELSIFKGLTIEILTLNSLPGGKEVSTYIFRYFSISVQASQQYICGIQRLAALQSSGVLVYASLRSALNVCHWHTASAQDRKSQPPRNNPCPTDECHKVHWSQRNWKRHISYCISGYSSAYSASGDRTTAPHTI